MLHLKRWHLFSIGDDFYVLVEDVEIYIQLLHYFEH